MGKTHIAEAHFRICNPFEGHLKAWPFKSAHYSGEGIFISFQIIPSAPTLRYILSGNWTLDMAGSQFSLKPGTLFCTMPSEAVEFRQLDEDAPWEWLELQFSGQGAESFLKEFGLSPSTPSTKPTDAKQTVATLNWLHANLENPEVDDASIAAAAFKLVSAVGAKNEAGRGAEQPGLVRLAKLQMESSFRFDESIEKLSARLGVERSTLFRAFKKETGMSPHEYIDRLRLIRAEELLQQTQQPVSNIASQTGFKDSKYFISWFKARKGQPPAAWRRMGKP